MNFLKLEDMDIEGKKVLVRVDYNVPIKGGMVEDDTKLKATIPTINFLLEKNCKIILMSHLGRPQKLLKKGISMEEIKKELTLKPIAEDLSEILGTDVVLAEDSIDLDNVNTEIPDGDVILSQDGDNIGIGTLSPIQALHAVGSGLFTGDLFVLGGDINLVDGTATSTLTSSGGNLGIGTTLQHDR